MIKLRSFVVAATLVAGLVFSGSAQAAAVNGSQGFNIDNLDPNGGVGLGSITSFTLGDLTTNNSQTGDFTSLAGGVNVGGPVLDTSDYTTFTFTDAVFGTFTTTSGTEIAAGTDQRAFQLTGTFSGGTGFPGLGDSTTATFLINFNQAGGGTNAISGSATLVTPALAVPEPSTLALAGFAALGLVVAARRRK